jgi:hypothetical protein
MKRPIQSLTRGSLLGVASLVSSVGFASFARVPALAAPATPLSRAVADAEAACFAAGGTSVSGGFGGLPVTGAGGALAVAATGARGAGSTRGGDAAPFLSASSATMENGVWVGSLESFRSAGFLDSFDSLDSFGDVGAVGAVVTGGDGCGLAGAGFCVETGFGAETGLGSGVGCEAFIGGGAGVRAATFEGGGAELGVFDSGSASGVSTVFAVLGAFDCSGAGAAFGALASTGGVGVGVTFGGADGAAALAIFASGGEGGDSTAVMAGASVSIAAGLGGLERAIVLPTTSAAAAT